MKIYRLGQGAIVHLDDNFFALDDLDWDSLVNCDDIAALVQGKLEGQQALATFSVDHADLSPPIGTQEVWAAGVTYSRSRSARMEESKEVGGGSFYDRVYSAERPELFFKASPHRVVGHRQKVRIRKDAQWSVPEPELTLVIDSSGRIVGYTIGNDMSARDIEGENPLYLPQAKVYDKSCALGPCLYISSDPLPADTRIDLDITRGGETAFSGSISIANIKRSLSGLVEFLFRDNSFPSGCFLMTGTGIVPPNDFTLRSGDAIRIKIEPIGVLENEVE